MPTLRHRDAEERPAAGRAVRLWSDDERRGPGDRGRAFGGGEPQLVYARRERLERKRVRKADLPIRVGGRKLRREAGDRPTVSEHVDAELRNLARLRVDGCEE